MLAIWGNFYCLYTPAKLITRILKCFCEQFSKSSCTLTVPVLDQCQKWICRRFREVYFRLLERSMYRRRHLMLSLSKKKKSVFASRARPHFAQKLWHTERRDQTNGAMIHDSWIINHVLASSVI